MLLKSLGKLIPLADGITTVLYCFLWLSTATMFLKTSINFRSYFHSERSEFAGCYRPCSIRRGITLPRRSLMRRMPDYCSHSGTRSMWVILVISRKIPVATRTQIVADLVHNVFYITKFEFSHYPHWTKTSRNGNWEIEPELQKGNEYWLTSSLFPPFYALSIDWGFVFIFTCKWNQINIKMEKQLIE